MMTGFVNADSEVILRLSLIGNNGQSQEIEVVIDTGYNGTLTLPPEMIASLSLAPLGSRGVTLADGSVVLLNVFRVGILWDGQTVEVSALEADSGAVLGMALLAGHRVTFDAVDGGSVTIIPIP
jgi:clan AA aspartic protease